MLRKPWFFVEEELKTKRVHIKLLIYMLQCANPIPITMKPKRIAVYGRVSTGGQNYARSALTSGVDGRRLRLSNTWTNLARTHFGDQRSEFVDGRKQDFNFT
jgi:hypothetical protein